MNKLTQAGQCPKKLAVYVLMVRKTAQRWFLESPGMSSDCVSSMEQWGCHFQKRHRNKQHSDFIRGKKWSDPFGYCI